MTTKTPNPTIELTLTSGATITSNEYSCAGTMVNELKIPLATLAEHRVVKLPTPAEVDTVTEKLGIILVEVKKLKHERDRLRGALNTIFHTPVSVDHLSAEGEELQQIYDTAAAALTGKHLREPQK
jgi:hypothetical protein